MINNMRSEKNMQKLKIYIIDVIGPSFTNDVSNKISST